MHMKNTITPEESTRLLRGRLAGARGKLTPSDAAAATGLPLDSVQEALESLMNTYICRLQVTESGEILYDFGTSLRRRGEKSFAERLADLRALLWKAFTVGFKIWITVMLVVYFTLFVIMLLVLLFANKDSKKGIKLGWIGDLFADLFFFGSRNMAIVYATDGAGYRHKTYQQRKRKDAARLEPRKRLVQSVYDFVFGPPRPGFDPLGNEKEVAAYLRKRKGILTLTEMVALAGLTYDEASEKMAEYLSRFKGQADITDDGVLVGSFDRMLVSGDAAMEGGSIELYWNEYEAPYEVTGNTSGRNAAIIGMNAFNLLFSSVMLFSPVVGVRIGMQAGVFVGEGVVQLLLGVLPFVFSLIFFAVPLLRSIGVGRREAARRQRNLRRRVLRVLFDHEGESLSLDAMLREINSGGERAMTLDELERIVSRLVADYAGHSSIDDNGTVLYRFERIGHELRASERLRQGKEVDRRGGEVIFDTGPVE